MRSGARRSQAQRVRSMAAGRIKPNALKIAEPLRLGQPRSGYRFRSPPPSEAAPLFLDNPFFREQSRKMKADGLFRRAERHPLFVGRREIYFVMIARFFCLTLLVSQVVRAEGIPDLQHVHSSENLARIVFSMATNDAVLSALLDGLDSTNSIQVAPYATAIPVREIYGTIIEERFRDALGDSFYEHGKKYGVREICSF
jgi:hypothetical protein